MQRMRRTHEWPCHSWWFYRHRRESQQQPIATRFSRFTPKKFGSNFQDLPLAEMLKPDAQGDAPEGDAPEDAAAPDAPKVRWGACSCAPCHLGADPALVRIQPQEPEVKESEKAKDIKAEAPQGLRRMERNRKNMFLCRQKTWEIELS